MDFLKELSCFDKQSGGILETKGFEMFKFSMMELLVVLGIILLMMGLLLPTVGPMMNRAQLNRVVTTIVGQLDIGYMKSLEKNSTTRVVFEYDPKGKNLTWTDMSLISGVSVNSLADEVLAKQKKEFDLNNDGVSAAYGNQEYLWIMVYGVHTVNIAHQSIPLIYDIKAAHPDNVVFGPLWMRRPISRVKDAMGNYVTTKMFLSSVKMDGINEYYYRPVINKGNYLRSTDEKRNNDFLRLMPLNGDRSVNLIVDAGADFDYSMSIGDSMAYAGPCVSTYEESVSLYTKADANSILSFSFGAIYFNDSLTRNSDDPASKYSANTRWFEALEGGQHDPSNINYGSNEDEDQFLDEGMSVSVDVYSQSVHSPKVRIPDSDVDPVVTSYNGYFDKIEDPFLKVSRIYEIGGKDKKGVMLRRVWGVEVGKFTKPVLLWSCDEIIRPGVSSGNAYFSSKLRLSTPFYFNIVFDQKNGYSGVSFSNSFGSAQVGKLYFQICDDDNKLTTMVEFSESSSKEGTLLELGFPTSPTDLQDIGYYQGVTK